MFIFYNTQINDTQQRVRLSDCEERNDSANLKTT